MPNDYAPYNPEAPEEQQVEEQLEHSRTVASLPVIEDVLTWFDEQIAAYTNPDIISTVSPNSDPEQVKQAVLFAQTVMKDYKNKRMEFANRFSDYIQP